MNRIEDEEKSKEVKKELKKQILEKQEEIPEKSLLEKIKDATNEIFASISSTITENFSRLKESFVQLNPFKKEIPIGRYVNIDDEKDFVELKEDRTFYSEQAFDFAMKGYGMEYKTGFTLASSGKYVIQGSKITFKIKRLISGGFEMELPGIFSTKCRLVENGFDCEDGTQYRKIKKKETKETTELLEETGPAALVPKPPEEEKPKEEQKETPEIITSIPSGKIAFVSDRDGNKEIYMLKANSTKAINLTNNSADDWDPVWSPDGSELAFVSDRDGANKIYIMDSNGSNVRGLTEGEDPYWFPDGSRIIFTYLLEGEKFMCGSSIYPRYGLFIINTNGKQKKEQLSLAPSTFEKDDMLKKYNLKDPIISPDGEKIAFSAGNWNCGWQHSIYVINLKGEFLNKYSTIPWKYPGDLFNPSWSPDGVKLIFNSYNGYHGGYCSRGAFFNDEIEFKWGKCNSELTGKWELDQRYDIWEVSEISQDRNKLLKGDYPVWSPSGKKIAFTGKGFNVFFMDNDGHNTKQVTNLGRNWDSDWSQ